MVSRLNHGGPANKLYVNRIHGVHTLERVSDAQLA